MDLKQFPPRAILPGFSLVYDKLQSDLVLEPLRGRGMVVRRDSVNRCTKARNSLVADAVRRALADALVGGMSPAELRDLFENELAQQAVTTGKEKKS